MRAVWLLRVTASGLISVNPSHLIYLVPTFRRGNARFFSFQSDYLKEHSTVIFKLLPTEPLVT